MSIELSRRQLVKAMAAGLAGAVLAPDLLASEPAVTLTRRIPSTGEALPVIGMGTWRTFNVGDDQQLRRARIQVLQAFFAEGGGMVDSSPMYGSAASVMGDGLRQLGTPDSLFSAEKVWTRDGGATRSQVAEQAALWGIQRFDLMQVHNLTAWQPHLETLKAMKQAGEIRYLGITTSHGRRHREFEQIMQDEGLDFVQLTYNLTHREVEQRLLPLALERGIAVIANRPYDGGALISRLKRQQTIPSWARDGFACRSWADFLLRFIVSHPAITCAIPATSRVEHLQENMAAGRGLLPDSDLRERMIRYIETL